MPSKTCDLDPLPTSILKKCIDLLLPAIHHIVKLSLSLGCFPDVLEKACVTPLIKMKTWIMIILKILNLLAISLFLAK